MSATSTLSPLKTKYVTILEGFRKRGRVLVAFSGGVDSALVLKLAYDSIGDDCLAVIADSPSLPRRELEAAMTIARDIGARIEIARLNELSNEEYRKNTPLRCYFCRSELGRTLREIARTGGYDTIADGANKSDLEDYRPGLKATEENGFWHPLIDFDIDKNGVRDLARWLGMPWWDKPSSPCLSSRIISGESINESKLAMIEAGEDLLHEMGFADVRVRHIRGMARIELPKSDIPMLMKEPILRKIEDELRLIGFLSVTVDPQGYRQGSMNAPG